jgi:predicted RNA-binding Zn ribbon-like protein
MLEVMTKIHDINGTPLPWLVGGRLCLDFVNTVEPRDGMAPNQHSPDAATLERREYLRAYDDLVAWGVHTATLDSHVAHDLRARARQHAREAQAALEQALAFRETIYRIFWKIAHHQTPAGDDVATLLHALAGAAPQLQLAARTDHLKWQWQASTALDQVVWPVLGDAVALLVNGDPSRIKMCPGVPQAPTCGWLFYDSSKNRSRHWCSMEDCGGAAKARRQNARRRVTRGR